MGSTNHGTQSIVWQYFVEASGENFGKRMNNILPAGIYSGGYLTRVNDSRVSLSTFVVEISDGTNQISVRTAGAATLDSTTLDSGAIASGTPYLVLRWSYVLSVINYVEIHALASLSDRLENDLVIGKCVFAGSTLSSFDYSDRTFPKILERNLQVETTSDTEMYVRVRGGQVPTSTGSITVPDQKVGPFAIPSSPNSRIDVVYVDAAGSVQILQGTASTNPSTPNYQGKLALATVRLVNGDTNILWNRITDVRSFLTAPLIQNSITSEYLKSYDSGWFSVVANSIYTKAHELGSAPFMVQIWFSEANDGSKETILVGNPSGFGAANAVQLLQVNDTNIQVLTGTPYIQGWHSASKVYNLSSSGYLRIKAIA